MGQGVSRPSHDAGSHRPPRPSLHHLRDECRKLSPPRRTRPQAWSRAAADARDNQGKSLIDAQRQSKTDTQKKCLRTSGPKPIMTSLPAAASNSDCPPARRLSIDRPATATRALQINFVSAREDYDSGEWMERSRAGDIFSLTTKS